MTVRKPEPTDAQRELLRRIKQGLVHHTRRGGWEVYRYGTADDPRYVWEVCTDAVKRLLARGWAQTTTTETSGYLYIELTPRGRAALADPEDLRRHVLAVADDMERRGVTLHSTVIHALEKYRINGDPRTLDGTIFAATAARWRPEYI